MTTSHYGHGVDLLVPVLDMSPSPLLLLGPVSLVRHIRLVLTVVSDVRIFLAIPDAADAVQREFRWIPSMRYSSGTRIPAKLLHVIFGAQWHSDLCHLIGLFHVSRVWHRWARNFFLEILSRHGANSSRSAQLSAEGSRSSLHVTKKSNHKAEHEY
jgi:hypothetical protein